MAIEEYWRALLDGTRSELLESYRGQGLITANEVIEAGVRSLAELTPQQLLAAWIEQNLVSRTGFRDAEGRDLESSIGPYPARLWAFHVAHEIAVHADDVDMPIDPAETADRQRWLAAVSRFALTELKDDVSVEVSGDTYVVRQGDLVIELDEAAFVAGTTGRAGPRALTPEERDLLSLGY